ncbi:unnamed protein product [Cylicocyclus nassatus]|uniref:Uncharacterized protein n=1 Tax=Cylicocyclus nassatus TaxID=53992 RepID=A0AA36GZ19_CYLNA|nr:unnamed protein product [Cylicocyclus nassatus]
MARLVRFAEVGQQENLPGLIESYNSTSLVRCYNYPPSWVALLSRNSSKWDTELGNFCGADGYDKNLTDLLAEKITTVISSSTATSLEMSGFCPCRLSEKCLGLFTDVICTTIEETPKIYVISICSKNDWSPPKFPKLSKSTTTSKRSLTATTPISVYPKCTQFIDATSSSRQQSVVVSSITAISTRDETTSLNEKKFPSILSISPTDSILSSKRTDLGIERKSTSAINETPSLGTSTESFESDSAPKTESIWSDRDFSTSNSEILSDVTQFPAIDASDSKHRGKSETIFGTLNIQTTLKRGSGAITTVLESRYAYTTIPLFDVEDETTSKVEASSTTGDSSESSKEITEEEEGNLTSETIFEEHPPATEKFEEKEEEKQSPAMTSTLTTKENRHVTRASSSDSTKKEATKPSTSEVSSQVELFDKTLSPRVDSIWTEISDFALSINHAHTSTLEDADSKKGSTPYNSGDMTTAIPTSLHEKQKISTESATPIAGQNTEGTSAAESRSFYPQATSILQEPLEDVTSSGRSEYLKSEATLTLKGYTHNPVIGSKEVSVDSHASETESSNYEETATTKLEGEKSRTKRTDLITKTSKSKFESTTSSHSLAQTLFTPEVSVESIYSTTGITDKRQKTKISTIGEVRSNPTRAADVNSKLLSSKSQGPTSSSFQQNSIIPSASEFSRGHSYLVAIITPANADFASSVTEEVSGSSATDFSSRLIEENIGTSTKHVIGKSLLSISKEPSFYRTLGTASPEIETSRVSTRFKATTTNRKTSIEMLEPSTSEYRKTSTSGISDESDDVAYISNTVSTASSQMVRSTTPTLKSILFNKSNSAQSGSFSVTKIPASSSLPSAYTTNGMSTSSAEEIAASSIGTKVVSPTTDSKELDRKNPDITAYTTELMSSRLLNSRLSSEFYSSDTSKANDLASSSQIQEDTTSASSSMGTTNFISTGAFSTDDKHSTSMPFTSTITSGLNSTRLSERPSFLITALLWLSTAYLKTESDYNASSYSATNYSTTARGRTYFTPSTAEIAIPVSTEETSRSFLQELFTSGLNTISQLLQSSSNLSRKLQTTTVVLKSSNYPTERFVQVDNQSRLTSSKMAGTSTFPTLPHSKPTHLIKDTTTERWTTEIAQRDRCASPCPSDYEEGKVFCYKVLHAKKSVTYRRVCQHNVVKNNDTVNSNNSQLISIESVSSSDQELNKSEVGDTTSQSGISYYLPELDPTFEGQRAYGRRLADYIPTKTCETLEGQQNIRMTKTERTVINAYM